MNTEKEDIKTTLVDLEEDLNLNDIELDEKKEYPTYSKEEKAKKEKENTLYLDKLIQLYYQSTVNIKNIQKKNELEVRFGTGDRRITGLKPLSKNDYDNVIKKMKSLGFTSTNENGDSSLRIQNEFLDRRTGRFKVSNIRTEINGYHLIQEYCRTNNVSEIIKKASHSVKFTKKEPAFLSPKDGKDLRIPVKPVFFNDFNFRVSYQTEEETYGLVGVNRGIIETWNNSKKTFRYMNRVTFKHADYPVNVDISIVKTSSKAGREYKLAYTTEESGVFTNPESYEIELEIDNTMIGPGTNYKDAKSVLEALKKCIKFVLGGLQGTNYPVSYVEQKETMQQYMQMIYKEKYDANKPVYNSNFIGPSSYTLQMQNVAPVDENSTVPNIRRSYTVTEKADGERHLLFVAESGKIYLINMNMCVIFTGAKTTNAELVGSLIDGELIMRDKAGIFINLYAAFDIYYLHKKDVRGFPFILKDGDAGKKEKTIESRYQLLKNFVKGLSAVSIMSKTETGNTKSSATIASKYKKDNEILSPIRIECKQFYPLNPEKDSIFEACRQILSKSNADIFEYNTDGLIFTPAFLGVGANEESEPGKNLKTGPLSKITWEWSFKWKPPQYNTIDFLITTVKTVNGEDQITPIFEEGTNTMLAVQLNEYKTIQLRCTFIEKMHGYLNPCQDVLEDRLPEFDNSEEKNTKEAKPVQFYPTNPYDPEAGIAHMMLRNDDNNVKQMFTEEGDVFQTDTIVEFSYNLDLEKGWRWVPLRVRYDKTAEYRQGLSNFGNAYHVANSNWQSIHNPITEEMICSGSNIPDLSVNEDIYYNRISGSRALSKTEGLRDFHNLYVKRKLILGVSKRGDTLVDYACGKGGDFPKWIAAHLSFVFGIDISKDNLENRLDGACARFLNYRKKNKNMPYALFVNGNSAFNIRNGAAMLNDKAVQITNAVFGKGTKDEDKLGKGVVRQYGKGQEGFNVSSCQFAIHYLWENPETLMGFLRNLAECTKLDGYFIGTCYDGETIFQLLKKKEPGESVQIVEDGKKVWEIRKGYNATEFKHNSSSIGYQIDVYQETINQFMPEYLVNFDYMTRLMEDYGFKIVDRVEAQTLGFQEGSGMFSELYSEMENECKKNPYKKKDYGEAYTMNANEKKISFLNRYFIYKKIRNINSEKVQIDIEDYDSNVSNVSILETKETKETVVKKPREKKEKVVKEKVVKEKKEKVVKEKKEPKIKKINKKIILLESSHNESATP